MTRIARNILLGAILAGAISMVSGQVPEFFPLDQIQPGLKGTGRTIFRGTEIEEFEVEILGVLKNFAPKQNLILAQLHGDKIEKTGVFAGMSGSPVFIDGKLVGAVAYSFPFSKEPIAGITPIAEMVDIFKEKPGQLKPARWGSVLKPRQMAATPDLQTLMLQLKTYQRREVALEDGRLLRPISTPISLSGFAGSTIEAFSEAFNLTGMVPVRGLSTSAEGNFEDGPLQPGSTVTVQMLRGDLDISASGTATLVSGNQVYAFGHPFLGAGYTDMPLNQGAVLTVISSLQSSQKVTATTNFVGAMRQDRATGILGVKGLEPKLLPVKLDLLTSRNSKKSFQFEVVVDPVLTPFLTTLSVFNSLASSERTLGGQTLQVKCSIDLAGQATVHFENSVADFANAAVNAALTASAPLGFLLNSGFEDLKLEQVDISISAVEEARRASLDRVWVDRVEVKPGEEVNLSVFLRKASGEVTSESYPIKIPDEITPGPIRILVGEGQAVAKLEEDAGQEFVPQDLSQLVRAINNIKKNDRLYIRIFRDRAGAVVGGEGLPGLPPSMLELYRSPRTAGTARSIGKVIYVEHELPPTSYVLSGYKTVEIQVIS